MRLVEDRHLMDASVSISEANESTPGVHLPAKEFHTLAGLATAGRGESVRGANYIVELETATVVLRYRRSEVERGRLGQAVAETETNRRTGTSRRVMMDATTCRQDSH